MNGGIRLLELIFLLIVMLFFYTEVDSIMLMPGRGQPRRSVPANAKGAMLRFGANTAN
ncbi:unnamed protein product [Meloidogyne enterolobii]|uniref:Uncharacterized protein n=1 Tax=Meloidogyne enterolobii TaxID=390850 RepID=A0ACB0ZB67_MELEN